MTDPDLEEFAGLWQEPDPAETERFEDLARRARRQGRLLGYADIGLAVLIIGGTILGIFVTPQPIVLGFALLLVGATIWLTWKRRSLRQMAATLNTSDAATFVQSSIRIATSNLRRATLSLAFIPLFVLVAVLLRATLRNGGHFVHMLESIGDWATSVRGIVALSIVTLMIVRLLRSRRRLRAELAELEKLRRDYEEENRRDRGV